MKKLAIKRISAFALVLVMLTVFSLQNVFATGSNPQTVTVKQTIVKEENGKSYENPERDKYTYLIEPMTDKCPVPEGVNGVFLLSGNDFRKIKIGFTEPGLFEYRIRRLEPVPEKDKITSKGERYFGFKVNKTENGLEVIPYTCTDPDLDFEEHLNGIVLNNFIYGVEKKNEEPNKKHKSDAVKTNDPLNIAIWVGVLLAAMVGLLFIKKGDDDNEA